jgi:hypothetical protein
VKPGELERNLSRLSEVARTARERLAGIERALTDLRHEMETLAARSHRPEPREVSAAEEAAESPEDAADTGRPRRSGTSGQAVLSGRGAGSE